VRVRPAVESDIPAMLELMRELAIFERYIDTFGTTEKMLREDGFRRSPPTYYCIVAEGNDGKLIGLISYFVIPFTSRGVARIYLKDVYVVAEARGQGVGEALMRAVARAAIDLGIPSINWLVADWNGDGAHFYERLGATRGSTWLDYSLDSDTVRALAAGAAPNPGGRDPRPEG
jgi:GNAT superfamily N-acetyltransferase